MGTQWIINFPVLMFSIIVHEYMHGYIAKRKGDYTAEYMGRLTFNPVPHIDPIGTIAFPLICYALNFPMFGWAKPVPVNPLNLKDPRKDMIAISLAGPLSNIGLAVIFTILIKIAFIANASIPLIQALAFGMMINLVLAIFNMIPLFPLDGSKIVYGLLPQNAADGYSKHFPYGMFILLGLYVVGGVKYLLVFPMMLIVKALAVIFALPIG